jgi:hypothetical protein
MYRVARAYRLPRQPSWPEYVQDSVDVSRQVLDHSLQILRGAFFTIGFRKCRQLADADVGKGG